MDEKKKNNKKRKVSVITVFLWLLLIVIMSVITIGSIYKQNAVEDPIDKVTIKLDMSEIDDEILDVYGDMIIETNDFLFSSGQSAEINVNFIQKENKVYTYELESVPIEDIKLYMGYFDYYEEGRLLSNEIYHELVQYYKEIKMEELKSEYTFHVEGEKIEINVKEGLVYGGGLLAEESNNITSLEEAFGNVVSSLLPANYTEDGKRYIGIKNNLVKSILLISEYEIYEEDIPLKNIGERYYVKDLTSSNEYYFHFKIQKGTVINIKVEGVPFEEAIDLIQFGGIYFLNNDLKEIELGEYMVMTFGNGIQIVFLECLPEDVARICFNNRSYGVFYIEKNGEKFCYNSIIDLNGVPIKPNEYNEINLTMRVFSKEEFLENMENDTYATEQIKWIDPNTGKAEIKLENTASTPDHRIACLSEEAIYVQKLEDEFILSSEYETYSNWKIVEHISDEMSDLKVPTDIINYFEENFSLKYIYVKDSNTIYWRYNILDLTMQSDTIYVYYKNYELINQQKEILKSHQLSEFKVYNFEKEFATKLSNEAEIKSPELGFKHTEERNLIVQKFDEDGVYYVGLFENNNLIKKEELKVVNGVGSMQINLENYDEGASYTIYEVDESGNKIDEKEYLVKFLDKYDIRNSEITSDKQIVSSVKSGIINDIAGKYTATIEESEGTGEDDYVDNMLSVTDIYQAKVTIGEEKVHKVTYETEEGGKLEGETEEYVKDGETPEKVPTPVPEEGYEFDKWVIVENGEEIEVDPNTYVPTKDVTFIAKFKKIDKIVDIDTSDIQVWVYIVVAIVAVVGIVVVVLIVRKNKTRK